MGNGSGIKFLCCNNTNKESQIEDIDINKNFNEYDRNYKTIKISNKIVNKDEIQNKNKKKKNNNIKKMKTYSKYSSEIGAKKKSQEFIRDSASFKEGNIALFNNTFQILNNTQQYISFPNMNVLKNNIINNQFLKSFHNSKINNSGLNFSKTNSNTEDILADINIKLILSGDLFLNKIIEIDKYGMKNSLIKKSNGVTIFGYKNNNIIINEPLYDYYFDLKIAKKHFQNNNNKEYNAGKVFEIFLDKNEKIFVLYFVHNYLFLYYKIDDNLIFDIDKDYYLILGDIFLTINIKKSINPNEKIIIIQVELDEKTNKYIFEQKDVPIKIGRDNCTINIPNPSISKLHSIIDFSNDTFVYKDAKSTNGSTLLIKEDDTIKIKGEMNFKLEDISFKIKEIIINNK